MTEGLRSGGSETSAGTGSAPTGSAKATNSLLEEAKELVAAGHAAKVWVLRSGGRWRYHCWIGTVHFHNGALPVHDDATDETAIACARALLPGSAVIRCGASR